MDSLFRKLTSLVTAAALLAGLVCVPAAAVDATEETYPGRFPTETVSAAQRAAVSSVPGTVLEGRSILFFGDSLTAGYGIPDYNDTWCGMLGTKYGMDVTCLSISGTPLTAPGRFGYDVASYYDPICQRELPEGDFDVVFVEGGGNDWYYAAPLGDDLTTRDTTCLMGAVNTIIDRVQAAYPNALLVFMTSWIPKYRAPSQWTPEMDYYETISKVCALRGVACYQARDPEVSGIHADDPDFRSEYFLTSSDAWHLNAAGQALFLPTIAGWLQEQVLANRTVAGFYDVAPEAWYSGAVQYVYDRGIMNGMTPERFSPDTTATRAMLVTMLHRAAGSPEPSSRFLPFEDVRPGSYYWDALCWAYENGVVKGMDEGHFAPDAEMTRQQLTTLLYRAALGEDAAEVSELPESLLGYADAGEVGHFAMAAMGWAVENGLVKGTSATTLSPNSGATRAQIATLFRRYLEKFPQ